MSEKPRWVDFNNYKCPECGGELQVYTDREDGELLNDGDSLRCKDCDLIGKHERTGEPAGKGKLIKLSTNGIPLEDIDRKGPVANMRIPMPPAVYDKYVKDLKPGFEFRFAVHHPETDSFILAMRVVEVHDENHFFATDLNIPFSYEVELIRGKVH